MDKWEALRALETLAEQNSMTDVLNYFTHVWNTDNDELTLEQFQAGERSTP